MKLTTKIPSVPFLECPVTLASIKHMWITEKAYSQVCSASFHDDNDNDDAAVAALA